MSDTFIGVIDAHDRVPTGGIHEVRVDQLFFSTTNRLGIIEKSNSVFSEVSRFSRDELVGRPHNLIRHPRMPQGAFWLMWDALSAGKPFCAYVRNLAKDSSDYVVFATITPLGDGYLSVRSRPCRDDLLSAAMSIYDKVRPLEIQWRESGLSARECAEKGAAEILKELRSAGFASMDEFIWAALPAEVQRRTDLTGPTEHLPCVGSLAELQDCADEVGTELNQWMARMDSLQRAIDTIGAEIPAIKATIADSKSTAMEVSHALGGQTGLAPIMLSVNLWASMTGDVISILDDLLIELEGLRISCAQTRFRIALARLHNDAVSQFVEELVGTSSADDSARPAIVDLTRALQEGIVETERQMQANADTAQRVADRLESAHGVLLMPHGLIANWRRMVVGRQDSAVLEMLPTIEQQMSLGSANLDRLALLAETSRSIAEPVDATAVTLQCQQMREAAEVATNESQRDSLLKLGRRFA